MWEQKLREQNAKEQKEVEEEQRKKREKELSTSEPEILQPESPAPKYVPQTAQKNSSLNIREKFKHQNEGSQKVEKKVESQPPDEEKEKEDLKTTMSLPDLVSSTHLASLDHAQKLSILRAIGIPPEFLFSSGLFDKGPLMSPLVQSFSGVAEATVATSLKYYVSFSKISKKLEEIHFEGSPSN
ncbi:hypothetical protein Anas_05000 [Armadillidium nasatum]|uniref:Uncharacterized protein n=1 Tax=Armadillidium nasatum TaxID=96803 RepID=A0A5N5T4Z9_9CRUS|nr:hypothetical protein Anas_05000 [Armadillidium nasatum]